MTNTTQYVVKTPYGAFVTLHSNGNEIYLSFTSLESAQKFTKSQLQNLYLKFKEKWNAGSYEVYEIVLSEKRCFNWTA